jgi:hypothetical protein
MQKTLRQLMDDIAHIDAGHIRQRTLEGYNRHGRDLHHKETWISEAPAIGVKPAPAKTAPMQGAKKWPQTDPEIRAFQRANPPLVVDGIIGKKTLARLTQLGYAPPTGFKPVADKVIPGAAPKSTLAPTTGSSVMPPAPASAAQPAVNGEADDDESKYTVDDWRAQAAERGAGPAAIPAKGDFSGGKSGKGRMPPGEMPPGAKPFKNNPTLQYVYNGQVYDLRDGYPISDESPMLAPGQAEREEDSKWDSYGNKRGSYKVVDVCPVTADTGLPTGGNPNEMDRIQKGFGRGMKLGATWDYKGAAVSIWYRPEGGKDRMFFDISTLAQIMGDWAGAFKSVGYNMTEMKDLGKITNSLGNGLGEVFSLVNSQGQKVRGAGSVQQIAFTTAEGVKSYATVDVSFLGPEAAWLNGGEAVWKNAFMGLKMAPGITQMTRTERKKTVPNYQADIAASTLPEGWQPGQIPKLELVPNTGKDRVVMYKGRRLVITGGRGISTRYPDFTVGAHNFGMASRGQLSCWVTGPGSAVCGF